MKPVKLFIMATCPHCQRALRWAQDVLARHPEYKAVQVETIDERLEPELADAYDYYFVPTYYVGDEKVHEGAASYDIVEGVYRRAFEA